MTLCILRPQLQDGWSHRMIRPRAAPFLDDGCVRPSARVIHRCLREHTAPATAARHGLRRTPAGTRGLHWRHSNGCDNQPGDDFGKVSHADDPCPTISDRRSMANHGAWLVALRPAVGPWPPFYIGISAGISRFISWIDATVTVLPLSVPSMCTCLPEKGATVCGLPSSV